MRAARRNADYAARKAAEDALPRIPVPEGRQQVSGEVVSVKTEDNRYARYGPATVKMLVRDDRGFKVWSTAPSSLLDEPSLKGRRVTFTASLTRSGDDEHFGFGKRPTKASFLADTAGARHRRAGHRGMSVQTSRRRTWRALPVPQPGAVAEPLGAAHLTRMSYCRWSSDDYQCDLYVYESDMGFEIHVAGNRLVFDEPLPPPAPPPNVDFDAWYQRHRTVRDMVQSARRKPIGLPNDGETYVLSEPGAAADQLVALRAVGYRFPERVIDLLREEQAELDAADVP